MQYPYPPSASLPIFPAANDKRLYPVKLDGIGDVWRIVNSFTGKFLTLFNSLVVTIRFLSQSKVVIKTNT